MTAIITDHKIDSHSMPTEWLRARVAGWMWAVCEGFDWWAVAITRAGEFIYASSDKVQEDIPESDKREYARKVIRYLNRECNHGGAWLAGWIGKRDFVLLWKDQDGDLQIQNVCDVAWDEIRNWDMEDWAEQAEQAHAVYRRINGAMEWSASEQVKLAQGQRMRHN